jgi:hypothetical protein
VGVEVSAYQSEHLPPCPRAAGLAEQSLRGRLLRPDPAPEMEPVLIPLGTRRTRNLNLKIDLQSKAPSTRDVLVVGTGVDPVTLTPFIRLDVSAPSYLQDL